jgi:CheY-like chemotaxis protein
VKSIHPIPDWLDEMPDMTFVVDEGLRITGYNRAFSAWCRTRKTPFDPWHKGVEDLFSTGCARIMNEYREVMERGRIFVGSEEITLGGEMALMEVTRAPFIAEAGKNLVVTVLREFGEERPRSKESFRDAGGEPCGPKRMESSEPPCLGMGQDLNRLISMPVKDIKSPEPTVAGPIRVLLVDDESMVLEMTTAILNHLGYEVSCAINGEEALKFYSQRPFDAVILDLTIKCGMGAIETIKQLLVLDPEAKAVLSTGFTDDPIVTEYAAHGFVNVITKPFDITRLADVLDQVLFGVPCGR